MIQQQTFVMPLMNMFAHNTNIIQNTNSHPAASCEEFFRLKETDIQENIQLNLYRILQEQTKNILEYAEASIIEIAVKIINKAVRLSMYDNGKGFDTKAKKTGIGLNNIKKRAEALSGKFSIVSAPGQGCEIIVEIPLVV